MAACTPALSHTTNQFVSSLKVLFDLLDDEEIGLVRLYDIESRWQGGCRGLPPGVLSHLRQVATPDGFLSFERFVLGLQNAVAECKEQAISEKATGLACSKSDHVITPNSITNDGATSHGINASRELLSSVHADGGSSSVPPWERHQTQKSSVESLNSLPDISGSTNRVNGQAILPANHLVHRAQSTFDSLLPVSVAEQQQLRFMPAHLTGDKSGVSANSTVSHIIETVGIDVGRDEPQRRNVPRRRESLRRHTLGHGLDYNTVRRMQLLEQEQSILMQGLKTLDTAREWYLTRMNDVSEKRKYATSDHPERAVESNEERLNFESSLIQEVNQQLKVLTESATKGFPFHMHLALPKRLPAQGQQAPLSVGGGSLEEDNEHVATLLRAQNKMLTREIAQKNSRIAQLEREKALLLRDTFELRSRLTRQQQQEHNQDDDDLSLI